MKLIVDIVSKYICAGKRIVIPELGAFLVKQPTGEVIFSEFLKQDDGVLRGELTREGMKPIEAAGAINRFVFEARHALRSGNVYPLEGIGTLRLNSVTSKILFSPLGAEIEPPIEKEQQRKLFTPPKPIRKKAATPIPSSPVEDNKVEANGNEVQSSEEVNNSAESSEEVAHTEESKSEGGNDNKSKQGKQGRQGGDKIVAGREFSGRFCDDELSNEPLRYTREHKHRGYTRHNPRAKRVDFVMIIAIVVLILAVGVIAYGVYISYQTGDSNPIINAWESTVDFFSNLF